MRNFFQLLTCLGLGVSALIPNLVFGQAIDDVAPIITLENTVPAYSNSITYTITYSVVEANPYQVYCWIGADQIPCTNNSATFTITTEGFTTFKAVAVDSSNNVSNQGVISWQEDWSPPVLTLTGKPAATTLETTAQFLFSVVDQVPVKTYCTLDGNPAIECGSPVSYTNLSIGNHQFELLGEDSAGNSSAPLIYNWTISSPPPSEIILSFLGVTSEATTDPDRKIDYFLGKIGLPYFYWTSNIENLAYNLIVKKVSTGQTVCSINNLSLIADATGVVQGGFNGACSLLNSTKYNVNIIATSPTLPTKSLSAEFTTDFTKPMISISRPTYSSGQASFLVTITDLVSGIETRFCHVLKDDIEVQQIPCDNNGVITTSGLGKGKYKLEVISKDNAQNITATVKNFSL
jgi:hypothetical protein